MSITAHFAMLGAPLKTIRSSWGAVRADGILFLRVWQDEVHNREGHNYVRLTNHAKFREKLDDRGYRERLEHVKLLRQGAHCFLVMCIAKDIAAIPRSNREFDEDVIYPGGSLLELEGDWWIELLVRVPTRQVNPPNKVSEHI